MSWSEKPKTVNLAIAQGEGCGVVNGWIGDLAQRTDAGTSAAV
jgi:hypothetical protein